MMMMMTMVTDDNVNSNWLVCGEPPSASRQYLQNAQADSVRISYVTIKEI